MLYFNNAMRPVTPPSVGFSQSIDWSNYDLQAGFIGLAADDFIDGALTENGS